jgi:hypothetical protein
MYLLSSSLSHLVVHLCVSLSISWCEVILYSSTRTMHYSPIQTYSLVLLLHIFSWVWCQSFMVWCQTTFFQPVHPHASKKPCGSAQTCGSASETLCSAPPWHQREIGEISVDRSTCIIEAHMAMVMSAYCAVKKGKMEILNRVSNTLHLLTAL